MVGDPVKCSGAMPISFPFVVVNQVLRAGGQALAETHGVTIPSLARHAARVCPMLILSLNLPRGWFIKAADTILNHMRHPRIERLNVRQKTIR